MKAQRFAHISVIGEHLAPTAYGDGYDAGDVLVYDAMPAGDDVAIDPHFALVVSRDGDSIQLLALATVSHADDIDGRSGTRAAADAAIVLPESRRPVIPIEEACCWPVAFGTYLTADLGEGVPSVLGCEMLPWDGKAIRYRRNSVA